MHSAAFEEKKYEEKMNQENAKIFHAQPLPNLQPFIPAKSNRPLTTCENVILNSDIRAEERRRFDEQLKQKERNALAAKEELRRQEEVNKRYFIFNFILLPKSSRNSYRLFI